MIENIIGIFGGFIFLYGFPVLVSYFGIKYQFEHEWKELNVDVMAFVFVFVPLLNWGYSFFTIMDWAFNEMDQELDNFDKSKLNKKLENDEIGNKFFRIKKK